MLAPTIEQLASEMAGRVKVAKLNVDENQQTAGRFNISGIPAMLIFKDGREVDRIVGLAPKQQIALRLQRLID
jgi:thioredoxin-like negative regulator of GroEL